MGDTKYFATGHGTLRADSPRGRRRYGHNQLCPSLLVKVCRCRMERIITNQNTGPPPRCVEWRQTVTFGEEAFLVEHPVVGEKHLALDGANRSIFQAGCCVVESSVGGSFDESQNHTQ